jgi:predicted nucleic acid-binding protein
MLVVSNSTALMHLPAMGRLILLRDLFSEVHIPEAVYDEVVIRGSGKPGAAEVAAADWVKRRQVGNALAALMLCGHLEPGEAECIVLATEMDADLVILDDGAARSEAKARGMKVIGTVGILLMADERGKVVFPEALDALLATGFRLHSSEYERVLSIWRTGRPEPPQAAP